jgi:serine/threonine protein kinase/tetratricopeptide (TPR) repeat protein
MSQSKLSVGAIFDAAQQLPPERRAAYLQEACGGDAQLRQRVEALLQALDAAGTFMEDPAVAPRLRSEVSSSAKVPEDMPDGQARGTMKIQPAEDPRDEAIGQTIGPYKLLEKVGEGGCGVVYVAEQSEPMRRRVALKVIKLGMDTKQVIARFEAERQALAMMDHPNIAKVLDAGTTETGRPYFAMELVRGIRITDFCDQAHLSTRERLGLFVKVCQAIQHAHQKGIIHRDIKPSNILVTLHDGVPVPKVIDFGIAKAIQGRLTQHTVYTQLHQFIGTPAYMSPEQAELTGLDIDTRSDIYSLGVLLYELLAGSTPFDPRELLAAGLDAMRKIIREQEPVRPSTRFGTLVGPASTTTAKQRSTDTEKLTHQLQGDLDWIVMKCLEKDRSRRYETANGLARDIERHLSDEPVTAGPPSTRYRIQKFARRNRGKVIAGGVVAAALVLGILGTTWGLIQAQRQARRARQRLAQIEKANDILGSIFEKLDPTEIVQAERPLQAILAEKLDQAVAQLEGESIGDPLVVAAMQQKFGVSLIGLGEANKAIVLLEKARATRQTRLGQNHADTLQTMSTLAWAYEKAGKLDLAVSLGEETLKLQRTKLGADHPDTLKTMYYLGYTYQQAGKFDLALPLSEQALKLRRIRLGADDPDTLAAMNTLGLVYLSSGRLDLALPLLEETLKMRRSRLGPEHPMTIQSMNNLANAYCHSGKTDLALPLREETLKLNQSKLGPDHPYTLSAMGNLAKTYAMAGKLELALPLLEETLKLDRAKLGPEHPSTLIDMGGLASAYMDARKLDLALPLCEETLRLDRVKLGPDHPSTLAAMGNLAKTYWLAGKLDLALPLFEETLKLDRAKLGSDHPSTLIEMGNLAASYQAAGKLDLALPLFEETLNLKRAKFGPDHPYTLAIMSGLAGAYQAAGKLDDAIRVWQEMVRIDSTSAQADTFYSLGKALVDRQRLGEALPVLRAAQRFYPDEDRGREVALWLAVAVAEEAAGNAKTDVPNPARDLAWARLARYLSEGEGGQTNLEAPLSEAVGDAQRALKLDPKRAEAWEAVGTLQWLRHQPAEALVSLDRALALRPESGESWELRGDILDRAQRPAEALEAYRNWIALLAETNTQLGSVRCRALLKHAAFCRKLEHWNEAGAALRQLGIAARDPGAGAQLVDLSAFYNAGFKGNWHGPTGTGHDLAGLPTGIQVFAGTRFDVRGLIHLSGGKYETNCYPNEMTSIPVGAKGGRIRFLQGMCWEGDKVGTPIARYVLHYGDGTVVERPLVAGRDVINWWTAKSAIGEGNPVVGWSGKIGESYAEYKSIQLYLVTWDNPRPDKIIASLDFVSNRQSAAPFLVAVTVE